MRTFVAIVLLMACGVGVVAQQISTQTRAQELATYEKLFYGLKH